MRLSTLIYHIANTIFGIYQRPFSSAWDYQLSNLIDKAEIINAGEHIITFKNGEDEIAVWCENRFYAFGHIYYVNGRRVPRCKELRPRARTMERLWDIYCAKRAAITDREYRDMFREVGL